MLQDNKQCNRLFVTLLFAFMAHSVLVQSTCNIYDRFPKKYFQTHFEKSIKIHPDPTTIYCLGVWHYKFSDLPWYQRQAAEIIFAKVPKTDFETALSYFLQAERIQPGFYSKNQVCQKSLRNFFHIFC